MNTQVRNTQATRGFTLVQVSIILTVAALIMVAVLPGSQTKLNADAVSLSRMNAVLLALREYEILYGVLPCAADASIAIGDPDYGLVSPTEGSYGCSNGAYPSANYYDATNNVVIGMVPVRALGLSNDYALDGYGRYITYAVDGRVTYAPTYLNPNRYTWSITSGSILVDDNGVVNNTAVALISHGADGYGAWLPVNAASGTGVRFNSGAAYDTDQKVNAHSNADSTFPANYSAINSLMADDTADGDNATVTFVKKAPTSTFDDLVVYKNAQWNISQLPLSVQNMLTISPPPNGVYVAGELFPIKLSFPYSISVSGLYRPTLASTIGTTSVGLAFAALVGAGQSGTTITSITILLSSYYATETGTSGVSVKSPITGNISWPNANVDAQPYNVNLPYGSGVMNGTGNTTLSTTAGLRISAPSGIAVDTSTNCGSANCICVVDTLNSRVSLWTTGYVNSGVLGSLGTGNGLFTNPSGIVADSSNNLYVLDTGATTTNNRVERFLYTYTETATIGGTAKAGTGGALNITFTSSSLTGSPITISTATTASTTTDATNLTTAINANTTLTGAGIAATSSGAVITITYTSSLSPGLTFSKSVTHATGGTETITLAAGALSGRYNAQFGAYGTIAGTFHYPTGLAIDTQSTCNTASTPCLWITDTGNNKIQSCSTNMTGGTTYCKIYGTGTYSSHALSSPTGIAVDSSNNIYVTDSGNNRVLKFTNSSSYVTASAIGLGVGYNSGYFESPTGIAVDGSNNIWVTDSMNNRVEKFNSSGTWQFTIGGGSKCISGSCTLAAYPAAPTGGSTALCYSNAACAAGNSSSYFNNPTGITIDKNYTNCNGLSCVYVVDDSNGRVNVFDTTGTYVNTFGSYGTGTSNFNF